VRRVFGVSVIILGLSAVPEVCGQAPAEFKAKLGAIVQSQKEASEGYSAALKIKTTADAQKVALDRYRAAIRKNMQEVLDLVRANPHEPANVEALKFVIKTAKAGPGDESDQAMEILLCDHVRDPGVGEIGGVIFYLVHTPVAPTLLRAVLEKNPNRADRGEACHNLAFYLKYQAHVVHQIREDPKQIDRYVPERSKSAMALFVKTADPDALIRESESLLERVVAEFADVEDWFDHRPLGAIAEGELFAMRHLAVGKVAPEITGKDQAGKPLALRDYRGKVVVLTFSGNWCGPCVAMYTQERELVAKLKDKPFATLSVNTDSSVDTLKKSIDSGEITWRCWYDGGITGPITTRWGVRSFPTIFVLDKAGVIRFKDVRGEALDKAVASLLDDTKAGT
jgi:peroxiredoxin